MIKNRSLSWVNITFVVLWLSVSNFSIANQVNDSTVILLLGDSLSASYGMKENQGWVHLLNQQLLNEKAPLTLINASISGETTSGGLARLPHILSSKKFTHLLIELGGNDGLRGFPPKLIKNNLLQIIALAKANNIRVMLMDIKIPPNYGERYNTLFNDVFQQASTQSQIPLLPFFMEEIALEPKLMQNDGIHPNELAQANIVHFMYKQLQLTLSSSNSMEN